LTHPAIPGLGEGLTNVEPPRPMRQASPWPESSIHGHRGPQELRTEVFALYLANKDPRTPRYAEIIAACVAAYAFSPIDLIPDPIPVLGYLDDILILSFGIALAIKHIPPAVMEDSRRSATEVIASGRVVNQAGAVLVIGICLVVALLATAWARRFLRR